MKMQSGRWAVIGYAKLLSGNWGLRGPAADLVPGSIVTAYKRSGGMETEEVGRLLKRYSDGSVLCTIAGRQARGPRGNGSASHTFTAPRRDPYNGDEVEYFDEV